MLHKSPPVKRACYISAAKIEGPCLLSRVSLRNVTRETALARRNMHLPWNNVASRRSSTEIFALYCDGTNIKLHEHRSMQYNAMHASTSCRALDKQIVHTQDLPPSSHDRLHTHAHIYMRVTDIRAPHENTYRKLTEFTAN